MSPTEDGVIDLLACFLLPALDGLPGHLSSGKTLPVSTVCHMLFLAHVFLASGQSIERCNSKHTTFLAAKKCCKWLSARFSETFTHQLCYYEMWERETL
jgi:hypothetical protein